MSSSITNRVRFLRLDRLYLEHKEEYVEALSGALGSGQVLGGEEVERFEVRLADRVGRRHAIAVSSGTDAMLVLLSALGVSADWRFLVPAYTFVATASPLAHLGAVPSFVEVDDFYHLDLSMVNDSPSAGPPKGMIAVGLFGQCLEYSEFEGYCSSLGIQLIEDAAQSFGSSSAGRAGGSLGIASTFSFAPTKPLPSFGNFGAIVTNDDGVAERARSIRYHGRNEDSDDFFLLGYNALASSALAAMLNVSLDHFDVAQRRRDEIAKYYLSALSEIDRIQLPRVRAGTVPNWHKFVIQHSDRDGLRKHLSRHAVETQVHYAKILPDATIFGGRWCGQFPNARRLSQCSLTLPLHAQMTDGEVEQVVDAVVGFESK